MSELYQLAEELRSEITRLHPEWLRDTPDLASWYAQRADWTSSNGFWLRARRHPDAIHQIITDIEEDRIDAARAGSKEMRDWMSFEFENLDLARFTGTFVDHPAGWEGDPFEAW